LPGLLEGVFSIEDITVGAAGGRSIRLRGRFSEDTSSAYARLAPKFRARGYTLLFRREAGRGVILAMPGVIRPTPNSKWLPGILAAATILSVLFSYVLTYEVREVTWRNILSSLPKGLPFNSQSALHSRRA